MTAKSCHLNRFKPDMFFFLGILNGLGEIRAHKLRSLLTITCVMMGVASLVVITGFISGQFVQWELYQSEMGWDTKVEIQDGNIPPEQQSIKAISPGRTLADVTAIRNLAHYAAHVSPVNTLGPTLTYKGNSINLWNFQGVTQAVLPVDHYKVDRGRFITDKDLKAAEQVIILGSVPVQKLFKGHDDPMGKVVTVNGIPFRVVGLLHDYVSMDGKWNMLEEKDSIAFIPITAMQKRLLGSDKLDALNIQATSPDDVPRLVEEVNNILLRTHRGVKDFRASTQQQYIEENNKMKQGFYLVGCGVGAVTLLVGGIGIMNLMLASINERVREIGIRKAIGAWNRDIFAQFMAEAIALSVLGGLAGVGVGIMAVRMMRHAAMNAPANSASIPPPVLSAPAVFVGLGFSVVVGIIAGLYPAIRASRLDPIEALRYE